MDIITRKESKQQNLKRYYTGKMCKHGHMSERFVCNAACLECAKKHKLNYYHNNSDKFNEYHKTNKSKFKHWRKEYRKNNIFVE